MKVKLKSKLFFKKQREKQRYLRVLKKKKKKVKEIQKKMRFYCDWTKWEEIRAEKI